MAPPLSLSPCKQLSARWDSGEEMYVLLSPARLKPCCLRLMRCARFAALVSCALAGSSALALGWVRLRHRELPASRKGWGRTLYFVSPFGFKGLLWPPTIAAKALRYSSKSHPPTTEKMSSVAYFGIQSRQTSGSSGPVPRPVCRWRIVPNRKQRKGTSEFLAAYAPMCQAAPVRAHRAIVLLLQRPMSRKVPMRTIVCGRPNQCVSALGTPPRPKQHCPPEPGRLHRVC